jgi:hypothetical protein
MTDPDRPRLRRGGSTSDNLGVVPSLLGLPPDMVQTVAVSDAKTRPEHPWTYSWASLDDEAKMKAQLEDMARTALGLNKPPTPASAPKKTAAAARKTAKPAPPPPPPAPAPLADEEFRAFELAYGSGATLVLTAHTGAPMEPAQAPPAPAPTNSTKPNTAPPQSAASKSDTKDNYSATSARPVLTRGPQAKPTAAGAVPDGAANASTSGAPTIPGTPATTTAFNHAPPVKYITLIAQPDLYGNMVVLLKNVTDSTQLDYTPRMMLVDAVDAMADNRGELLFEMRGATQRQFALYRVLRGQVSQIFEGGGEQLGTMASK